MIAGTPAEPTVRALSAEAVFQLQAQVFREKCQGHQALQLVRLNAFELDVALQALEHYPKLRKPGRQAD